jgi:hypothetical protein
MKPLIFRKRSGSSFILYIWLGMTFFNLQAAAQQLPKPLTDQVEKDDPGSKIISLIEGDFNGDGLPDYALLLKEPVGWKVKAYHAQKNGPYVSFDIEDFGTDPAYSTTFLPEQFRLVLVKKGEILEINGRSVPRTSHAYDAIKLEQVDEPGTASFYDWTSVPDAKFESIRKNGTYTLSGFGGLGNE